MEKRHSLLVCSIYVFSRANQIFIFSAPYLTFLNFLQYSTVELVQSYIAFAGSSATMFPMSGSNVTSHEVINYNYLSNYDYQNTIFTNYTYSYYQHRRRFISKRKNLNFVKNHGTWQSYCRTKVKLITIKWITYHNKYHS